MISPQMLSKYQRVPDFNLLSVMYGIYDKGGSQLIFPKNQKQSTMPGQGTGKEMAPKKEIGVPNASPGHQTTRECSFFEEFKGLKLSTAFPSILRLKNATEKCHFIIYIKIEINRMNKQMWIYASSLLGPLLVWDSYLEWKFYVREKRMNPKQDNHLSCWLVALFHMVLNMPRYIPLLSFCVSNSFYLQFQKKEE